MSVKKPISLLNPITGGMLPLDPDTLIEIAWPDPSQPTGYASFKLKLSELQTSLTVGGDLFTAEDGSTITSADQDNGHNFVAVEKLREDLRINKGSFSKLSL
jgi:hypothetical protein